MTTEELRQHCHDSIDQIDDERILKVILDLVNSLERHLGDPIVGYEADGTAVRASEAKAQFAADLNKPEEFVSIDDFARELEASEAA